MHRFIRTFYKHKAHLLLILNLASSILIVDASSALSLTLDEAISLAKENLSSYKASLIKIRSSEALYDASLSPYLPSLDLSTSLNRHYAHTNDYSTQSYNITLSYALFDGGSRRANRNIAQLNLENYKEEMRKTLINLEYSVKSAFYTAAAQKEILEQRKIQLQDAQKDFEVAEGRHKFGVAKLSDVLQASVRLEQARFNLMQSEGDFRKSIAELNSLIGRPLDAKDDMQGNLDIEARIPDKKRLSDAALRRPEIKQAEISYDLAENNRALTISAFYPILSASAAYSKMDGGYYVNLYAPEEKILGITATWNIFELEKYFKKKSSEFEKNVSQENLNETKRTIILELHKTYEDFITSYSKLTVAQQQLKQAEYNYSQAFWEYKVGKADILSLVQAESQLANSREQLISSKLSLILSKSLLEKAAGVQKLEDLIAQ